MNLMMSLTMCVLFVEERVFVSLVELLAISMDDKAGGYAIML
jgi:hypothetical protein